jgi:RNA polymerase sigma-70 factor (ECF subfamily)
MHETTDAELMAATRSGDRDAFGVLVDRHQDVLVNYLTHIDGSRDRAEEFAQEAFVKLYRAAARYDVLTSESIRPLLCRIATNLVRSDRRRAARLKLILLKFVGRDETHVSPQSELLRDEIQRCVSAAIAALPLTYRTAIVLRDIEGWSYREIAEALDCEEGTVKSRICRGRDQLRALLDGYWNGDPDHGRERTDRVAVGAAANRRV